MKDVLPLLINNKDRFIEYRVETKDIKEKYLGSESKYDATTTTLLGIAGNKKALPLKQIHTGMMSSWDERQTKILHDITEDLNDFGNYKWKEIKKPLMVYWEEKREQHREKQLRQGRKNPSKLGGDSTLWRWGQFMSSVIIAKYSILEDDSILEESNEGDTFEKDFDDLVIGPVRLFAKIKGLQETDEDKRLKTIKIVDEIIQFSRHLGGLYEDLLDPMYKSKEGFLSREERRQLRALYSIYEGVKKEIETDSKLDDIEKNVKIVEFWESYQGKNLLFLQSKMVYGGSMSFEEKEEAKSLRAEEICRDLEKVLMSWNIDWKNIQAGLEHYQKNYEEEVYKRQEAENNYQEMVSSSKSRLDEYGKILRGIWDGDHLNFIGIMIGIVISFGLTFGTMASNDQWLWGIGSAALSAVVLIALFKWMPSRKLLSKFSRWVLKPGKKEKTKKKRKT